MYDIPSLSDEHLWIKVLLLCRNWLLLGDVYRSPSRGAEESLGGLKYIFQQAVGANSTRDL